MTGAPLGQDAELAAPCRHILVPFAANTCGPGWGSLLLDPQPIASRYGVVGEGHPRGSPAMAVAAAAALGHAEVRCCNTMAPPLQRVPGQLLRQLTHGHPGMKGATTASCQPLLGAQGLAPQPVPVEKLSLPGSDKEGWESCVQPSMFPVKKECHLQPQGHPMPPAFTQKS